MNFRFLNALLTVYMPIKSSQLLRLCKCLLSFVRLYRIDNPNRLKLAYFFHRCSYDSQVWLCQKKYLLVIHHSLLQRAGWQDLLYAVFTRVTCIYNKFSVGD